MENMDKIQGYASCVGDLSRLVIFLTHGEQGDCLKRTPNLSFERRVLDDKHTAVVLSAR